MTPLSSSVFGIISILDSSAARGRDSDREASYSAQTNETNCRCLSPKHDRGYTLYCLIERKQDESSSPIGSSDTFLFAAVSRPTRPPVVAQH